MGAITKDVDLTEEMDLPSLMVGYDISYTEGGDAILSSDPYDSTPAFPPEVLEISSDFDAQLRQWLIEVERLARIAYRKQLDIVLYGPIPELFDY